jgi:diguanylate cyclase (GGDEF)-like protein
VLEKLKNQLKASVSFPSPPAVAQQIIALASDADIDLTRVASIVSKDPGLTAKILRVANSPLYAKRRKSENLRQALVALGLNAATSLALSFSLVGTYNKMQSTGIDYARYWRRTILSASAARAFAEIQQSGGVEDVFLAALLQDIGILAIDRVQPEFYRELAPNATHAELAAYEIGRLTVDHAYVGAWLLEQWKLPENLYKTVAWTHLPPETDVTVPAGLGARCIALGSECVDLLLSGSKEPDFSQLAQHTLAWLGVDAAGLTQVLGKIVGEIPEIERIFDTRLLDAGTASTILDQARELLMLRSLQAIEQVGELKETTEQLEARAANLQDLQQHDALTGVFNRGHLDVVLDREFRASEAGGWPLSLVFLDLDHFKRVNDTYGHAIGDAVLVSTAQLILAMARDTDCVARYGGEEFVIILPGISASVAERVCQRLVAKLRTTTHAVPGQQVSLIVTASLGLATRCEQTPFRSVAELLEAADRAAYTAKHSGRNQLVRYDPRRMPDDYLGGNSAAN